MLRSDYHVHFYGADMTYKSDYRIGLRLISDYSTCQAESLVKACDKASRCRWCGEKLNLIKVFFDYEDGTQHNPLHEAVHREGADLCIGESLRPETVCGHICRAI